MKTRIIPFCWVAVLFALCASPEARANEDMLASAKNLYESASYEAALSELVAIDNTELADIVDTYRALCLLGLGRARDAEQVLQLVVMRKPLLVLSDSEYSPRVVALFHDVRKKALPAAAQRLYTVSRTDYENKNYDAAVEGFKQALSVIADAGAESQTATLADLKELASGFLVLAEAKAAAAASARVPAVTPPPVAMKASRAFYTLLDTEVTPPVARVQTLPPWTFAHLRTAVFTGTLEVVIDEKGAVESAALVEPVWPMYDAQLLHAAKLWRYEPALKDGKPVKFKKVLSINVNFGAPGSR
jgi:tetratricopeptide (TPR) repeat protein